MNSRHLRRSLAWKLLYSFGGVSVLVTLATMALIYWIASHQAYARLAASSEHLALTFSQEVQADLERVQRIASTLASEWESAPPAHPKAELEEIVRFRNDLEGVSAVVSEPRPVRSCESYLEGGILRTADEISSAELAYLKQEMQQSGVHWSTAREYHSQSVLSCSIAWHTPSAAGVVATHLSLDRVREACRRTARLQAGRSGYVLLVDDAGKVLAGSGTSNSLSQLPSELFAALHKNARGSWLGTDPLQPQRAQIYHSRLGSSGLTLLLIYPQREILEDVRALESLLALSALAYIVAMILLISLMARSIAGPLQALIDGAQRLFRGDLDASVPELPSHNQMAPLAAAFNSLSGDLKAYVERFEVSVREQERAERELEVAGSIQRAFLVRGLPNQSERDDFQISAHCTEASRVGGDFYDFFFLDPNRLGFLIADPSGKGVPAAIYMAMCRTLLRALAFSTDSPAACFESANQRLCEDNPTAMFVTALYGILDTRTGDVRICNAGHLPPFLRRSDGLLETLPRARQRPLGVRRDSRYSDQELLLAPEDLLLLYTDGVSEAENPQQELFGVSRLQDCLRANGDKIAAELIERLLDDVHKFTAGAAQSDDLTALALRFCRSRKMEGTMKLHLDSQLCEIPRVQAALEELAESQLMARRAVLDVQLALEELLANIIQHGYRGEAGHRIEVEFTWKGKMLWVTIEDEASPFDPRLPGGAVAPPPSPGKTGGWGRYLASGKVETLEYERTENRNVTLLHKWMGENK